MKTITCAVAATGARREPTKYNISIIIPANSNEGSSLVYDDDMKFLLRRGSLGISVSSRHPLSLNRNVEVGRVHGAPQVQSLDNSQ
jgi:hypothetical protein